MKVTSAQFNGLNLGRSCIFAEDFEGGATSPVLPNPTTTYLNESFETAGTTQMLWKSLGTDATGTLTYWGIDAGAPSIAANVVTVPGAAAFHGGHTDWADMTATLRIASWNTTSAPALNIHRTDGSNYVQVYIDGGSMILRKVVGGAPTVLATVAFAPVNGTAYWLRLNAAGTTFTATVFADTAGAIGGQLVTGSGVAADAVLANGHIGITNINTVSCTVGGAFTGVCTVTGPAPTGAFGQYVPTVAAGEPAFCWSKARAYYGTYSLSQYNAASGAQGYWTVGSDGMSGINATWSETAWLATGSTPTAAGMNDINGNYANSGPLTADSTWHFYKTTFLTSSNSILFLLYGAGTVYFDNCAIFISAIPTNALFRSLGTDATGTLNAWTVDTGAPTLTSNFVSVPSGAALHVGHADWTDSSFTVRFVFAANTVPVAALHWTGAGASYVAADTDGLALYLRKSVSGAASNVTSTGVALTAGSAYWLRIQAIGTTYTASLFSDFAGAIGSQIATVSATVSDAVVQSGTVAIYNVGTVSVNFGGAYPNVCLVQGAVPTGWTPTVNAGEPAFAWSSKQQYGGNYSASVYNAHTSGDGYWLSSALTAQATPYTLSAQIRATGAGTAEIGENGTYAAVSANDSAWHLTSEVITPSSAGIAARMLGAGTAYFDNIDLSTTTPIKIVEASGFDDLPSIRNGNIPKSADHGAFLGSNWLDARATGLHLRIAGQAGQQALDTLIDSLRQASTVQATQELVLILNQTRQINARAIRRMVTDKIDDWGSAWTAEAHLEFESSDPRIYANSQSQYVFNANQTWGVVNTGTFATRPVATISGAVTNPEILDVTTGAFLKFTLTMIATDSLVIDFSARTILLNGVNKYSALTSDSTWFDLAAGLTTVQYVASGASTLTLTYRSAWV